MLLGPYYGSEKINRKLSLIYDTNILTIHSYAVLVFLYNSIIKINYCSKIPRYFEDPN